jgi:triosephosphate isomerase
MLELSRIPMLLGAQDISPFSSGTYTGAVSGHMIKDLVSYVLVGHSERRNNFGEREPELLEKMIKLKEVNLEPIYCVQDEKTRVPDTCHLVGFEPPWAISSGDPTKGHPDSPEHASEVIAIIKKSSTQAISVFYGGSTTSENVAGYANQLAIDGVIPGGASLKAETFYNLIKNASTV